MIPTNVVETLVEIGRSGDPDDPTTAAYLDAIGRFDSINREHWRAWDEITDQLPTPDVVALTKGLVLAERHHRWNGGSVAAAIWTFRTIRRRDSSAADDVANWILPRTQNPWVPFGGQTHGARSVEEYRHAERWRGERIAAGLAAERESQERAEAERIVRKAQRERSAQDRDSDIRQRMIAELNDLTIEEQLYRLATDVRYSVEFYPTRIAGAATKKVMDSLDEKTRLALWMKLKGRKRGPWSRLKRRVVSTFAPPPWNRRKWF
jgi:hypothetical protein